MKKMPRNDETNWTRRLIAAEQALLQSEGVEQARSNNAPMSQGDSSFANYNIWASDLDARIELNASIDRLRKKLWTACDL